MNRVVLSVLLAAVVALFSGSIARLCFPIDESENVRGFVIETSNLTQISDAVVSTNAKVVELGLLIAEASIDDGKKISMRCALCHTFNNGGSHKQGPNLWNIVNSAHAAKVGFNYSNAMKNSKEKWTFENLYKFIYSPVSAISGTKMTFAGIKDPKEIAAILKYLATLTDGGVIQPPKSLKIAQ